MLFKKKLESFSNHFETRSGKSVGLKFIPNQSNLFRFIPKSVSALIRTHPSQSEEIFGCASEDHPFEIVLTLRILM